MNPISNKINNVKIKLLSFITLKILSVLNIIYLILHNKHLIVTNNFPSILHKNTKLLNLLYFIQSYRHILYNLISYNTYLLFSMYMNYSFEQN